MKTILLTALAAMPFIAKAQTSDSLFVTQGTDSRWYVQYAVRSERSVFDVAKKFGVPAAAVADANRLSYTDKLNAGGFVKIPLSKTNWYNYLDSPTGARALPLFYRVTKPQSWSDFAQRFGVLREQLCKWNGLKASTTFAPERQGMMPLSVDIDSREEYRRPAGAAIAVGWISLENAANNVAELPTVPSATTLLADTSVQIDSVVITPVLSPIEQAFLDQTADGTMVTSEKGPAAFFPAGGGTVKGVHYAFHNTAARGSVVRVHNIGTSRTVYVKVLGPLPRTKQYAGAIIGVSAAAKAELGVKGDTRAFCEVSYAGY